MNRAFVCVCEVISLRPALDSRLQRCFEVATVDLHRDCANLQVPAEILSVMLASFKAPAPRWPEINFSFDTLELCKIAD